MATAIEAPLAIEPDREQKLSAKNEGGFISRTVRDRNKRGTNRRWQPTRSEKKRVPTRGTLRAVAIAEEQEPRAASDAAEWFENGGFDLDRYLRDERRKAHKRAIKNYLRRLRRADLHELGEHVHLLPLERRLRVQALRELRLIETPEGLAVLLATLESDEELQGVGLRLLEIERPLLEALSAA